MHQALVDSIKASMVAAPQAKNNGAVASKFVDMRGWDSVDFLIAVGATDATVNAKAQVSDNADGSSPTDISGAAITQIAADGDNVLVVISVKRDSIAGRYVGISVTAGNATDGALFAVIALRYGPDGTPLPVDQEDSGTNTFATSQVIRA